MKQVITEENFQSLIDAGKPVVMKFGATWCAPCRRMAPIIDQLAEKFQDRAIVGEVDIEEQSDLAQQFGIRSVPTTFFLKDGQVVDKLVGLAPLATLEDKLNAML